MCWTVLNSSTNRGTLCVCGGGGRVARAAEIPAPRQLPPPLRHWVHPAASLVTRGKPGLSRAATRLPGPSLLEPDPKQGQSGLSHSPHTHTLRPASLNCLQFPGCQALHPPLLPLVLSLPPFRCLRRSFRHGLHQGTSLVHRLGVPVAPVLAPWEPLSACFKINNIFTCLYPSPSSPGRELGSYLCYSPSF